MIRDRFPIQISLVDSPEALWPRRAEWQALVERNATSTVFQTLEWHRSWWKAFGKAARGLLLVAEAGGQLVAIAPLMVSEQRILGRRRRVVEFIGTHGADYCDFIVDQAWAEAVPLMLEWLQAHSEEWDLLHLINIAEASPLLEILPRTFGQDGYEVHLRKLYECPTRILSDRVADEQLLKKRNLRGRYDRVRRQGRLEFAVHTGAAEIEAHLDAFFQQHIDRWTSTATPSFFHDERQRVFYREQARLLAPEGWVILSVVSFNGIPISYHFGFEYGERIYVIKPTYHPDYRDYAPGMLQIRHLLEYAMARGARELDFTIGEEAFKYKFANHARMNYSARIYPRWMFYGIDRVLMRAKAAARPAGATHRLAKRLLKPLLGDSVRLLGL
jgi:CelD/BcsL family acetyltransferase involved in cellulose biosynthesis